MRFFKSYLLIVLLTILTVTSSKVYAAFPIQPQAATNAAETVAQQTDVDFKVLVNSAIERLTQRPASAPAASGGKEGAGLGIASFAAGLGGLAALVAAVGFVWPVLVGVSILASIAAIILGAKGLKRPKRGFAITGLVLGIVNLGGLIIAFLLALLLLILFSNVKLDVM